MEKLNIYIVHSLYLENRKKYINSSIRYIVDTAKACGFETSINVVKEPSSEHIEANIETYNKRVKYEKEEGAKADDDFNKSIQSLNVKQISNIEKHRTVYSHILNENELHLVVEDDVVIGEAYVKNIENLFQKLKSGEIVDWDVLFTCVSIVNGEDELQLVPSRSLKKLKSKSSYFIRPFVCKNLFNYLDIFKYNLKTGISKFLWDNTDIRAMTLNNHTFLEGSKIGTFASSTNASNFLYQNNNFINLAKLSALDHIDDEKIKSAEEIFENANYPENPDFLHTMGVIYFKKKDYARAKEYMTKACDFLESSYTYCGKSSEILNNAINIYQYNQPMLSEYKSRKSKYS